MTNDERKEEVGQAIHKLSKVMEGENLRIAAEAFLNMLVVAAQASDISLEDIQVSLDLTWANHMKHQTAKLYLLSKKGWTV